MSLFDKLKDLFTKDAQKYAYVAIPRDHVNNPGFSGEPLQAGKHYFRLWLAEMFLEKEVDWFRTWHPVAHSLVVFQFGHQNIEIPHLAGPSHLNGVNESNLEKLIPLNYAMTTLMPFNGGVVEVVAALVAMQGQDYIGSVIKVLGDLSKLLVVPQLSGALNIALPIAAGVQDLLGGSTGRIHLGVHQSFTGDGGGGSNILRSGYIAVIRGSEQDYPAARLWIDQDRLRIGGSLDQSALLTGVTHLLFRIESRTDRDDWGGLKDISDAKNEALKYLGEAEPEKAESALKRAILLCRQSPDLTRADRNRVSLALKEEFDEARKSGLGAIPVAERSLESIVARRAVPVEEALVSAPGFEKLFGG